MFFIIYYLIIGKLSLGNLSGPIGIYNIVGESAKAGFINVIYLIGYICVNVVLNVWGGSHFFEKMAGIFGGRKWLRLFSAKG